MVILPSSFFYFRALRRENQYFGTGYPYPRALRIIAEFFCFGKGNSHFAGEL